MCVGHMAQWRYERCLWYAVVRITHPAPELSVCDDYHTHCVVLPLQQNHRDRPLFISFFIARFCYTRSIRCVCYAYPTEVELRYPSTSLYPFGGATALRSLQQPCAVVPLPTAFRIW